MTLHERLPGRWLPEEVDEQTGDGRPLRPDLPWLRNLRWVKLHALQLGFALGVVVYWGQLLGVEGVVFGLVIVAAEALMGEWQEQHERSHCNHVLGWHDAREKPWYFITAGVLTWALLAAVVGVP